MLHFGLNKDSPVPFYRQIVDQILGGISAGAIAPGDRLPTIRELAVRLEVNPNTIVKAYTQLQILDVLDTQQGSGVFVKARPARSLSEAERKRILLDLCRDFVGRAQLADIGIDELIERLTRLRNQAQGKSSAGE